MSAVMSGAVSSATHSVEIAAIREHCRHLRLPTVGAQCERLAEETLRQKHTPLHFLDALLTAELDERERSTVERRTREAHLPRVKTLEEFDFAKAPLLSATQIMSLAEGGYLQRSEPVMLRLHLGVQVHVSRGLLGEGRRVDDVHERLDVDVELDRRLRRRTDVRKEEARAADDRHAEEVRERTLRVHVDPVVGGVGDRGVGAVDLAVRIRVGREVGMIQDVVPPHRDLTHPDPLVFDEPPPQAAGEVV